MRSSTGTDCIKLHLDVKLLKRNGRYYAKSTKLLKQTNNLKLTRPTGTSETETNSDKLAPN